MNSGLAFWAPFVVIFGAALIVSVAQRYARDVCLMKLDAYHVLIQTRDGQWVWGQLEVHSKALELIYLQPRRVAAGDEHLTQIFYEQNIADIALMLRPEPAPGSADYVRWVREMKLLRHPPFWPRLKRDLRNL